MSHLIQKLIFALGGITIWLYSIFMNLVFSKNNNSNIGYYIFENEDADNSGMDTKKKNFVIGIFTFIFIIFLIDFFD